MVSGAEYGMVLNDNSVNSIYQALTKVANDNDLRKKGQELCYNKVQDEFTWKQTTDNLERIIKI